MGDLCKMAESHVSRFWALNGVGARNLKLNGWGANPRWEGAIPKVPVSAYFLKYWGYAKLCLHAMGPVATVTIGEAACCSN